MNKPLNLFVKSLFTIVFWACIHTLGFAQRVEEVVRSENAPMNDSGNPVIVVPLAEEKDGVLLNGNQFSDNRKDFRGKSGKWNRQNSRNWNRNRNWNRGNYNWGRGWGRGWNGWGRGWGGGWGWRGC